MASNTQGRSFVPVVAFLFLGLLLGGAWLVLGAPEAPLTTDVSAASPDVPLGSAPVTGGADELVHVASEADSLRLEAEDEPLKAIATEPAQTDQGETALAVSGRFVEYVNGLPADLTFDGETKITVSANRRGRSVDVPVQGGRFELSLTRNEDGLWAYGPDRVFGEDLDAITLRIRAPSSIAGRSFVLHDPGTKKAISFPEAIPVGSTEIEVALMEAAVIEVAVLDKTTGAHLEDVDVYASDDGFSSMLDPRSQSSERLVETSTSPVLLQPTGYLAASTSAVLTVSAKGYAWAQLTVDLSQPNQRSIELEKAGELKVNVQGLLPRGAMLRLRRKGDLVSNRRAKDDGALYDSLPPGEYKATVEVGEWYSSPMVLGSATASVQEGLRSEVSVLVEELEPMIRADFAGSIYIPKEWSGGPPALRLKQLSTSKSGKTARRGLKPSEFSSVEGRPGWFSFSLKGLETGFYSLTYSELNFTETFDLPPEGIADFEFRVPPPVQFTVGFVDRNTGQEVPEIDQLTWTPRRPKGVSGWSSDSVDRDPESGDFAMCVPDCEISISTSNDGYMHDSVKHTPIEGERLSIEVWRRPTAAVELRDGDRVIPWPEEAFPELVDEDGDTWISMHSSGADGVWFGTNVPGTVMLTVPNVPGFEPHPPVEVVLEAGPRKTVVIQLTAKR